MTMPCYQDDVRQAARAWVRETSSGAEVLCHLLELWEQWEQWEQWTWITTRREWVMERKVCTSANS